ncbi:MAG: AraC family transcriptional regulator [Actinomycetota bacterium]|nr:AraC family transcriptional regulator [Actinomycetota bacterium]
MSGATQALLTGADVSVTSIACPGDGATSVQELVGSSMHELCLVRSGSFLLRGSVVEGRAVEVFADPTVCLFGAPEHVVEVTHPRPGGDLDTCVFLSEDVLASLGGVSGLPALSPRTREVSWLHRRLLALCWRADTDSLAAEETALALFVAALEQAEPGRWHAGRPQARDRRRLADEARAALVADPTIARVVDLAQMLGCSPHHLSRLFREETGHALAQFRTALRIELALERVMQGEHNLARVAADLGFADHAHLTRTMRRTLGQTPSAMRALISSHRGSPSAQRSRLVGSGALQALAPPPQPNAGD